MHTPQDKLGRKFGVGDYIVYGHALGRCAGLRIGKVLAIKYDDSAGDVRYYTPWKITVIGVDDDWAHNEPKLCKKGTLMYPNRILRFDDEDVPEEIQDLYIEAGL